MATIDFITTWPDFGRRVNYNLKLLLRAFRDDWDTWMDHINFYYDTDYDRDKIVEAIDKWNEIQKDFQIDYDIFCDGLIMVWPK